MSQHPGLDCPGELVRKNSRTCEYDNFCSLDSSKNWISSWPVQLISNGWSCEVKNLEKIITPSCNKQYISIHATVQLGKIVCYWVWLYYQE